MANSHLALEAVVRQDDQVIARCLLRRGRYVIGQERKNEIVADAASISGKHARLTVASDEHFFIEDLGSANGTFVDGRAIREITAVTLESQIALGQAALCFQRGGLPAAVFRHLPEGFLRASRYGIEKVMIEGRTSTIYEARDTVLHRRVAMKVLHRACQSNPTQVLAFVRENQIVAQLAHSCILPVYDFGLDGEIGLFTATRFVEGESLGELLAGMASADAQAPQATLHGLLLLFLRVCDAVAFAHARGVVHGSLHPDAVIFGRFGEVFVDHWGFATIGEPTEPEKGRIEAPEMTTRAPVSRCIAPEQAEAGSGIDPRADVYALGAILFRILTLRHWNAGESEAEIVARALQATPTPAEALAAAAPPGHLPGGVLPERLAAICARALSRNREERFPTAHELKAEIVQWLEQAAEPSSRQHSWKLAGLFGKR
jgi:serine/threonine protein kinase